jgi:hypothetical protein
LCSSTPVTSAGSNRLIEKSAQKREKKRKAQKKKTRSKKKRKIRISYAQGHKS